MSPMKKSAVTLATLCLLALPVPALAQGFGVAARAGTLGAGVEAALGLSNRVVVRGGVGLLPLKPNTTINNIDFKLTLPKTWYNLGVDLYVTSAMRIGVGMLFKTDNPVVDGTISPSSSVQIGDSTYTSADVSTLHGILASKKHAPYVLIGFGKHTATGVGLFLDLGAAFLGDPNVTLSATGNPAIVGSSVFQSQLRAEETKVRNDSGTYLKVWPILDLGVRIGFGN